MIDMAREAGFELGKVFVNGVLVDATTTELKAFEALVRADEREAAQAEHEADKVIIEYHEATIKRLEAAILAEREACAKVCENIYTNGDGAECWLENAAEKIRARSGE
jgi:hypothetical protein